MSNLDLWEKVRVVPKEAQKEIKGGRLKGMTDINPLWRMKALTEQFGMCGVGWKYVITKQWIENGANGEISAFVNIDLFIKVNGEWSEAIPGTGGSAFVANETRGLYTSDECFKMALTDAISVSCKALGFGADIYWQGDRSKYDKPQQQPQQPKEDITWENTPPIENKYTCTGADCGKEINSAVYAYSKKTFGKALCRDCQGKEKSKQGAAK